MTRFNNGCVLRGGSWGNFLTDHFLTHHRLRNYPDYLNYYPGFRCISLLDSIAAQRFVRIK